MHELAITQALLAQVLSVAKKNNLKTVDSIHIALGQYTSFVDESIDFYWKIIAKDTPAAAAKIIISRLPGKVTCLSCHQVLNSSKPKPDLCPHCGSFKLKIEGGDELLLEEIKFNEA